MVSSSMCQGELSTGNIYDGTVEKYLSLRHSEHIRFAQYKLREESQPSRLG